MDNLIKLPAKKSLHISWVYESNKINIFKVREFKTTVKNILKAAGFTSVREYMKKGEPLDYKFLFDTEFEINKRRYL